MDAILTRKMQYSREKVEGGIIEDESILYGEQYMYVGPDVCRLYIHLGLYTYTVESSKNMIQPL